MKIALLVLALCLQGMAQQPALTLEQALAKVAAYEIGDDEAPIAALDRLVGQASASPETREAIERALLKTLEGQATLAGKLQICRELELAGSASSVPALAKLLDSPETAEAARYALERIPSPAASQALRTRLPKSSGKARVAIVNSLGRRKDAAAVAALRGLIPGDDPSVAGAAAAALGLIADPAAIAALLAARSKTSGALRSEVDEACLHAAEQMSHNGDNQRAFAIYRELSAPSEAESTRIAALHGLAIAGGKEAVSLLTAALKGDPRIQAQAICQLATIPGPEVTALLGQSIAGMDTMGKVRVLTALAGRGDKAALPVLLKAAGENALPVRIAALRGLGSIGDASVVLVLAETASKGHTTVEQAAAKDLSAMRTGGFPEERRRAPTTGLTEEDVARESLYRLRGADIDRAVVAAIARSESKVKVELIAAASGRGIKSATPVFLAGAADADRDVQRASLRALRDTAGPADTPGLFDLLVKAPAADRAELGRVLSSALRRSDNASVEPVMAAYRSASDAELRGVLLAVLGQVGRDESLPLLRSALKDNTAEIRRAAILALSDWPTSAPMPDLIEPARSDPNPAYQILSLQGYLKLIGLPDPRTPAETVRMLSNAMSLAKRPDEKKYILSMVQRINTPEALTLAEEAMKDPEVAAEAKAAADRIRSRATPARRPQQQR